MHDPALSDEADPLYRPLGDLSAWAGMEPDERAWARAAARLDDLRARHPAWSDMVLRGARLAAAHQSGALDGVHGGGRDVAMGLLRAAAPAAVTGPDAWPHVQANHDALALAGAAGAITEDVVRRVHEVACRPQVTHRVDVEGRTQDHVFAHGEYKHHPNHVPTAGGGWRARAPVARVGGEMRTFVGALADPVFRARQPVTRAAYALHGVSHVAPFADGNGRVARALASAVLGGISGIPLLVVTEDAAAYDDALARAGAGAAGDLVRFVLERNVHLADTVCGLAVPPAGTTDPAFDRWREQATAAQALSDALPAATARALERHRARPDLGWLSPLAAARIVAPAPSSQPGRFDAAPLVLSVPVPGGATVEEVVVIDAHPVDGEEEGLSVRAGEARLRLGVALGEPVDEVTALLGPWLDRVVSTLALRVAAETE